MENLRRNRITRFLWPVVCLLSACLPCAAKLQNHFDVVTFCCDCSIENHLCEPQFDALNWQAKNGHYLAMGSDAHRNQIVARGNQLAIYYNFFNDGKGKGMTAVEKASIIGKYAQSFTHTGARPDWIILNEISAGRWPVDAAYRKWVVQVVSILRNEDHLSVVLCAPFRRPGEHAEDWRAVTTNAWIGIECYLGGKTIKEHGFSTNWCEAQYRESKEKYMRLGIPAGRLFLVEDFANTEDAPDKTWGRQGVSAEDWDKAITVRSAGSKKVGFAGFVGYGWSHDAMKAPDEDLIRFENTSRAQSLP
ncbi:MAG TPA: hypothetical protein VH280_21495 [Verrucomicrobiae bacterium]|jgi:hypothetical protein|nr:hypothetical protein [Verrucomicrobiae bacterium]